MHAKLLSALPPLAAAAALCACADAAMFADSGSPSGAEAAKYSASGAEMWEEEPAPDNAGDSYEDVGTNPFVMTAHDPLSTFAADVDTASYDIFRRDIGYGALPQPASVRLEEYVNAFDYGYPTAGHDAPEPFGVALEAAPSPFSETTLLRIGIRGKAAPPDSREGANLVFLVDVSGSMASAAKLPLVQALLIEAVDVLEPSDRIALVAYAGAAGLVLPSTPVSQAETIKGAIANLTAGGSTAGAEGIDLAYQQAEAHFLTGGVNHVVLCTDGDFNVGPYSNEALVELIEAKRKTGVTLTVLGFGTGNLNDAMMEAVSNAGNGIYGVIANQDHAIAYANQDLLRSIYLIAQDVKIQVEFNAALVVAYRLLGYENRALQDDQFQDDLVDAGEIGSEHTVTALYELVLSGGDVPVAAGAPDVDDGAGFEDQLDVLPDELALVKIRYKHPGAAEEDAALQIDSGFDADAAHGAFEDASGDLQWAAAIAAFAEILKGSPYGDASHLSQIDAVTAAHAGARADRQEFRALFGQAMGLLPTE